MLRSTAIQTLQELRSRPSRTWYFLQIKSQTCPKGTGSKLNSPDPANHLSAALLFRIEQSEVGVTKFIVVPPVLNFKKNKTAPGTAGTIVVVYEVIENKLMKITHFVRSMIPFAGCSLARSVKLMQTGQNITVLPGIINNK